MLRTIHAVVAAQTYTPYFGADRANSAPARAELFISLGRLFSTGSMSAEVRALVILAAGTRSDDRTRDAVHPVLGAPRDSVDSLRTMEGSAPGNT